MTEAATDGVAAIRLQPLEVSQLLVDRVALAIQTAIVNGELSPGTRLSVPEISRQLGVSRTPAREALYRLEREGLVHVTPRRGAVVLTTRPRDLVELFGFREALEGMAARLGAQHMTDAERVELREAYERHKMAVVSHDVESHLHFDMRFHELFIDGSRNNRIAEELARVRSQLRVMTREMSDVSGALDDGVVNAHEAIVAAIEQGDKRAAEAAARAHVRGVLEFYRRSGIQI